VATPRLIRFGQFELDPASCELRRRGISIKLQPQQLAVLSVLAQRAGQVVSRDEIRQQIWGSDTFVDFERGINFAINQIRAALGDDPEKPRFIETVPRRGYRFIAPIKIKEPLEIVAPAPVELISGNRDTRGHEDQAQLNPTPDFEGLHRPGPAASLSKRTILVVSLIVFAAAATWFVRARASHAGVLLDPVNLANNIRTFPLATVRGYVDEIAFSPDDRQIAFTWYGPSLRKQDIYVQLIGGDRPLQITHTQRGTIDGLFWSPDGRLLSFARCGDEDRGSLNAIPALGGPERKLTDVACTFGVLGGGFWTPDGRSLVFSDKCTADGPRGISVFTFATGQKRCLAIPDSASSELRWPTLSPDGNTVAFVALSTFYRTNIFTIPLAGGTRHQITHEVENESDLMWSRDGTYIIFFSTRGGRLGNPWWKVPAQGGAIEPATEIKRNGTKSRDGRLLGYVQNGGANSVIWRIQLSGPGAKVISKAKVIDFNNWNVAPQLSPDGKHILYTNLLSGADNIWKSDANGSNPLQLTTFGEDLTGTPRWSPDGKWFTFDRRQRAHAQIYVMDSEGRNSHAVTDGSYDNNVSSWSRDQKSIYFSSNRTGHWELWKHDLGSGVEAQVTQHGGFSAFESYDGKDLYYTKYSSPGIWRMPVTGGPEQRITDRPETWYWGDWDVTQAGLYFVDVDVSTPPSIKFYDFRTRTSKTVFQTEGQIDPHEPRFGASRDGRTFLYAEHDQNSTIMIVENLP
jgi:Tol biopolymer transport system component/DNA-binding winged helix-turn-helix (wHTH) protein